ncbi:MAG TPA: leucyl/phenylalanyl-tRNA--protein transferase [Polyangiaceae bacterium]|nr:leucyl/phenylalanyl-tRNA--protein transferase [Polyangiaceae bacterium]
MATYTERARAELQTRVQRSRELLERLYARGPSKAQRLLGSASAALSDNPLIGLCGVNDRLPLTAEQMIFGYSQGLFPLDRAGKLRWHCPEPRFVLYLSELRLSPNMRRDIRKSNFTHSFDREPRAVLDGCAEGRADTWLSERLKGLYLELHELGVMHTIETWRDGVLVGGSFGLAIGKVFTGETMFHRVPDAGKSSFAFLASHLRERGFCCIDAQSWSEHMVRFGAKEVPLEVYRKTLALGLTRSAQFNTPLLDDASQRLRESAVPIAARTPDVNCARRVGQEPTN